MEENITLAPVVLFVYNRPEHTKKTVMSLLKNEQAFQSDLYVFSDGARAKTDEENVRLTREYIKTIKGFNQVFITERDTNIGLANSVIAGVSEIINRFERAIVVEDDLEVSRNFLRFMNHCLEFYENNKKVFSISGYCAPIEIPDHYKQDVFSFRRINSWGWATWSNRWNEVDWQVGDFDNFIYNKKLVNDYNKGGEDCAVVLLWQQQNKIDSWAIRFNYACFRQGGINIYPVLSKVKNIGADGSGQHVKKTKRFDTKLDDARHPIALIEDVKTDIEVEKSYQNYFRRKFFRRWHYLYEIASYRFKNRNNV